MPAVAPVIRTVCSCMSGSSDLVVISGDLSWDVAVEREDEAHRLVADVGGGVEHARAAAVDHGDAVLAAVLSGGVRDAAGAEVSGIAGLLDEWLVGRSYISAPAETRRRPARRPRRLRAAPRSSAAGARAGRPRRAGAGAPARRRGR